MIVATLLLMGVAHARDHLPDIQFCLQRKMVGSFRDCVPMADRLWHAVGSEEPPARLNEFEVAGLLEGFRRVLGNEAFLTAVSEWRSTHPSVVTEEAAWLAHARALAKLGRREEVVQVLRALPERVRNAPGEARFWSRELGVEPARGRKWESEISGPVRVMAHTKRVCGRSGLMVSHSFGHLSIWWKPKSHDGTTIADLADQMAFGLARELGSVGINTVPPVNVKVFETSDQLCRETGIACTGSNAHNLAFANPWLDTAYWVCGHSPLHEVVHVALGTWGGDRLDPILSEGFATALDGTGTDWRTPGVIDFSQRLGSLDDLWLAYAGDPATIDRVGPIPPGAAYGLAASFARFLGTGRGGRLDTALSHVQSRRTLIENGFGINEGDAFAAWKSWLTQP